MAGLILPPSGPLSPEDEWVLKVLTNYVGIAKREGMSGTDALSRMSFQSLIGLLETGAREGGDKYAAKLVRHTLNELQKVCKERGFHFVHNFTCADERGPELTTPEQSPGG